MKYNVLNITIYAMLIAFATLAMIACPEPDKSTTKTTTKKGIKTGPFTVTFALDGGTGNNNTKPQTVTKGNTVAKPTAPTKTDFAFGEWYQDKERLVPFFFDTDTITDDITLYAGWNKPNHFTVRFHPNGGTVIKDQIIALNSIATRPTYPPPPHLKIDRTFGGWYKDKELKTVFEFTTETITKNIIIYAGWGYTVTFNTNSGSDIANQPLLSGSLATKPTNPTLTGYTFVNWYTDNVPTTASTPFDFDTETITKNTTLYAGWGHTVTFNTNGGSDIANQPLLSGNTVTKPENPTKTDLAFVNWYTDSVPTTTSTPFDVTNEKITTDTTLYAGWGFAVTFNTNGGSDIANQPLLSGSLATKPENPTKVSGIFDNWYKDEKLLTPFKFDTDTITMHTILYAGWISTWKAVATGDFHTVGIKTDDTLWAWGENGTFQLGLGNKSRNPRPTKVGNAKWKAVAAGAYHTVGIQEDGTLWAWGWSEKGQLGIGKSGARIGRISPAKVDSAKWKAVAAKSKHTFGIQEDGTLWAWGGDNKYGHLGVGDTNDRSSPTKVGTASWKAVDTDIYHTVGIQDDGTLWAWGYNASGQIGNGKHGKDEEASRLTSFYTEKKETRPVQVSKATWQSVAAGWQRTFGIQTDGTLWAWGKNTKGHLGTGGNKSIKPRPTKIGKATDWSMTFASDDHAFGIQTNGTLFAWGRDVEYGQLGLGDTKNRISPTPVGTASWKAMAVAAAEDYTVGIQENGTLWAWGKNTEGQLGLGDTKNRTSPTLVK